MDAGEISVLMLLDLSKCFDVVMHQRLLDKLSQYGVETEWFSDYFPAGADAQQQWWRVSAVQYQPEHDRRVPRRVPELYTVQCTLCFRTTCACTNQKMFN